MERKGTLDEFVTNIYKATVKALNMDNAIQILLEQNICHLKKVYLNFGF